MKRLIFILITTLSFSINAQIISQFDWNSGLPTTATVGPNATSVSSSAYISTGGKGGTNGLNAGTPKMDINLIIPGSPTFDVQGIDLSIDYQRDESQLDLVKRGASLLIRVSGGNVSVSYRVKDGVGSYTTVSSGNIYSIPNDDTYRTYRFYYLPSTGVGRFLVDNVEMWSNDGIDNRDLYWTPSDDVVIGALADGSGSNRAFFDNFIVGSISTTPLPITLNFFKVQKQVEHAMIEWQTASEINNDYFTIEKSIDAKSWSVLSRIDGAGNSTQIIDYSTIDQLEKAETIYYRLKQTDFNGDFSYSEIQSVEGTNFKNKVNIYPNPTSEIVNITYEELINSVEIYNLKGELHLNQLINSNTVRLNIGNYPRGTYFLKIIGTTNTSIEKVIFN
ncbi:T9SS type A sorting domain-containing protein [Acidiluteibacter ferrifornacis]|uniref:T9SS type A sorting domain-containing protein n=1 Tax=Acidiluteibacter ferrifornacis TaxID=2692424 RepID=A0A6N9NR06_9FLAO|nr:T9SS type A sorting domain-containing protein [Acidiluteibacter ferrifornacis]NBG66845.1 T9SS type A sorting domain-containing protein [Acidiluteibacter ferrifornacis]